ncbi:hypothetical protein H8E07_02050, partial [bacterium]|nr:hypothetical protein [bacterium]
MNARELLSSLEADGVRLTIKGDRLVLDAPKGVLSPSQIEEIRPYKPELLAILSERRGKPASEEGPERDSFDDIVEDARRFQRQGKPGPWGAYTLSAGALDGAIGNLPPDLRADLDLRLGIYRRGGLPAAHGRRLALVLLAAA